MHVAFFWCALQEDWEKYILRTHQIHADLTAIHNHWRPLQRGMREAGREPDSLHLQNMLFPLTPTAKLGCTMHRSI